MFAGMTLRILALVPWLALAACGKSSAPAADVASPPTAPAAPDAGNAAPADAAAKPADDIATGMATEVGLAPVDAAPAAAAEEYLVWTPSPAGYTTVWLGADGTVLASRYEVVLYDGADIVAMQARYTEFREVACEFVDTELPPPGGKLPLGPKRFYPYLVARVLGTDLPERVLLKAYDGDGYGDTAKDGRPPTYWGEHWGRSFTFVGGEGARLLMTECDGGYGCGAHGETGCTFIPLSFGDKLPQVDLAAVDKELPDLRKAVETGWVDGEEVNSEGIDLDGIYFDHRNGELVIGYQYVASVSYAGTDGSWSSYTQARIKTAPPQKSLGFRPLPAAVSTFLKSMPVPAPTTGEPYTPRAFGWSAIPASPKRDALLAAFKDSATLAPPAPKDETAEANAGANDKLAEGRKATKEKRYPDAIKAFDEAIAASATLARAWSGRGYAKLLNGDGAGAKTDFEQALTLDATPKFQAAVYFNLGELAMRNKDVAAARAAFTKANELSPSDAAKKQLGRLKTP